LKVTEPTLQEKVKQIAEVIEEIGTEWECNFIESMQEWRGEYTDSQEAIIEKLWEKACESPL
jgi:hypothetical protein